MCEKMLGILAAFDSSEGQNEKAVKGLGSIL